ncbi:MAG: GGDEF domain-containing protein [Gammaproteobacteria bacterium]|nr:MAG: GGDEF domain-containing protein [Gammaproteobacteria bacterium]
MDVEKRIDQDLHSLSIPGIFIYAVVLPLIFWSFEFYVYYPEESVIYSVIMLTLSGARLVHKKYSHILYERSRKLWFRILVTLLFLQAAIIGMVLAQALYDPLFSESSYIVVLCVTAISSGALIAQTPRVGVALANMTAMLLPTLLVFIVIDGLHKFIFLLVLYYLYQSALAVRTNKTYLQGIFNEEKLDKQRKELEVINRIDPLTQIYNRGHFNSSYELHWEHARRNQKELSILLVDIDHFKSINDNYGHLFGDKCLVSIAEIIHRTAKRKTDIIARFGGEEFVILLNDTSRKSAMALAEDIRKAVEGELFSDGENTVNLTVSIGVSRTMPLEKTNPNNLINDSDKALYKAKAAGRNQVHYHFG